MQNIKSYNLKVKEHKTIAAQVGLNPNRRTIVIKQKHSGVLNKKIKQKQKTKEGLSIFVNFGARLKNYRYFRNINGYPCRGQRTHTNAKTKKKNKFKGIL